MKSLLKISIGDDELLVCTVSRFGHLTREKQRVTECQMCLHTELSRVKSVMEATSALSLRGLISKHPANCVVVLVLW